MLPFYFAYNIPDPMGYNTYLIFYRVLPRHCLSCLQLSAEIRVRLSTRRKSRDIDIPGLVIAHRSHPSPRSPLNGNLAEMLPVFCRLSVTSGVTCALRLQYVGPSKQKSPSNDFLMISRGKPINILALQAVPAYLVVHLNVVESQESVKRRQWMIDLPTPGMAEQLVCV